MQENKLKANLLAGQVQLGCGVGQIASPEVLRVLRAAGFDWAFIDAEHGSFGPDTLRALCLHATLEGIAPMVRVGSVEYTLVARALDAGAAGIIFPRVDERETLERAVSWARYPPVGTRGYGLTGTHVNYENVTVPQVMDHMNANTLVIVQIETRRAVEQVHGLVSVPGVDGVLVGPADLSIALGIPGEWDNPRLLSVIDNVIDVCVHHGKIPGIQTRNAAMARFWRERGMKLLGCSNETMLLFEQAKTVAGAILA